MEKLNIDPKFRDKIPPLTEDEFNQLRDNILEDGEVYEPIITWNNTIIDGHNRWRVICENWELLKDKYRIKAMDFADEWEASEWMYKKQLGRRNLTDEEREYMIGKMNEAAVKIASRNEKGQFSPRSQSGNTAKPGERVVDVIAKELGVGTRTVSRAANFAKSIDAIREVSPEVADKIMSGKSKASKSDVRDYHKLSDEAKAEFRQRVMDGTIKKRTGTNGGLTKEDRAHKESIAKIVEDMCDPTTNPEYTIDFLLEDIEVNGDSFVSSLKSILKIRSTLLTQENRPAVAEAIDNIIQKFIEIKELVKT